MLLSLGLCLTFGIPRILAVSITASDLPECAIECYVNSGSEIQIPITDYEGQCRSGEFQVLLRKCAENTCTPEEFAFVPFSWNNTDRRRNFTPRNTAPNSE